MAFERAGGWRGHFIALGAAAAFTLAAASVVAALLPAGKPPPSKPVMLTAAAPLVAKPVPTEVYTRPASAAPVKVILANPYTTVAAPVTVAKAEPPAVAVPAAEPPWVAEIAKEPRRRRERRAQAGEEESNVCTRHKLRKVWVSERRWRCRK